jgi:N-methylhydantoinase A/oxoprolinase/acetone carboxylase beta subunit
MSAAGESTRLESTIVGVDTGGTFTDVVVRMGDGRRVSAKALTTPDNLLDGLMASFARAAEALDVTIEEFLGSVQVMRYSGTTATNALLTHTGAPVGMLTTAGFEDTVPIGRVLSASAGLTESDLRRVRRHRKPPPLVDRVHVYGITERMDADGDVVVALDVEAVKAAAEALALARVASIAICFLWSIRNPAHEQRAQEIVERVAPGVSVHCSHEIAPAVGEYERFTTTLVDAYVSPVLTRFLRGFQERLRSAGFGGQFLVAKAEGGCLYPDDAKPVSTVHSGPAAGVIASALEGAKIGFDNVIATDVGGTSFDVGLVIGGAWAYAREPQLARLHLSEPMIEVASVGAGGGSVVWADEADALHVGPTSVGSYPGPACYDQGGSVPTLTDADLLLGYLDADAFLGGRMTLSRERAWAALEPIAKRLGLDVVDCAAGVFRIANAHMGDLLARQVVGRGHDPRDFVVFAYGGAGPMHAAFYGQECGVSEVVVPMHAGTFSALGVASAPLLHSARTPVLLKLPTDPEDLSRRLMALEEEVIRALRKDGVTEDAWDIVHILQMRYGAQIHTMRVAIPHRDSLATAGVDDIARRFDMAYEREYGVGSGYPEAGRLITGLLVEGRAQLGASDAPAATQAGGRDASGARIGEREAYFDGDFLPTSVYDYSLLRPGHVLESPAVIEAPHTTVLVPASASASIDVERNVRMVLSKPDGGGGGTPITLESERAA